VPLLFVTDAVTDVDDLVTSAWASATNGWRTAVRWGPAVAEAWLPVSTINIVDADKLNRATVVDVRQETEYANGHLPGALHLELGALPGTAGSLPSGRPVVAMCANGQRSMTGIVAGHRGGTSGVGVFTGSVDDWADRTGRRPLTGP